MKIMFLGNSHTYYHDMPEIFRRICLERGKDVDVTMHAHPDKSYKWHLAEMSELRFALMHSGYDYVILQQAAHPGPSKEETLRDAKTMVEMAKGFGVTPIQTMPWCEKRLPEHQEEMYDIFETVSEKYDVKINPIGRIFEDITKNHPEIDMYWIDGEHASPYGAYANALSTYATIFGESVKGISPKAINNMTTTEEEYKIIKEAYKRAGADPDNKALQDEALDIWNKYAAINEDKEAIEVVLDSDKVAIIQEVVDKYAL
ncbi:MAG: hypothetical protein E7225_03655 [Clostridiales bacterium]|nr:hypothetical protein [Clostridiales bacterium]